MTRNVVALACFLFLQNPFVTRGQNITWWEDFSGNPLDSGWTIQITAGNSQTDQWRFDNPCQREFGMTISGGQFAIFDNACYGSSGNKIVELISPIVTLPNTANQSVGWYEYFEGGGNGLGEVYFEIRRKPPNTGFLSWKIYQVDSTSIANPNKLSFLLDPYIQQAGGDCAGGCDARLRFVFSAPDAQAFWWMIDDVMFYITPAKDPAALKPEQIPFGCVASLQQDSVQLLIKNLGEGNISTLEACFQVSGFPTVCEFLDFNALIGGPLVRNALYLYTFQTPMPLREGWNPIRFWTQNPDGNPDEFPINDTIIRWTYVELLASVDLPFSEGFEDTATLHPAWCFNLHPSGYGRMELVQDTSLVCSGTGALLMTTSPGRASIDALDLMVNLSPASCVPVRLSFVYQTFHENIQPEDGLFLSVDNGVSWIPIHPLDSAQSAYSCYQVSLSLDSLAQALGISLTAQTILRWQRYGQDSIPTDGVLLDSVTIWIDTTSLSTVDARMDSLLPATWAPGDTLYFTAFFSHQTAGATLVRALLRLYVNDTLHAEEVWLGCLDASTGASYTFTTPVVAQDSAQRFCVELVEPNYRPDVDPTSNRLCVQQISSGFASVMDEDPSSFVIYESPAGFWIRTRTLFPILWVRVYTITGKKLAQWKGDVPRSHVWIPLDVSSSSSGPVVFVIGTSDNRTFSLLWR